MTHKKPQLIGKRIKTIERISQLAGKKKSVYMAAWEKRMPAAFIINMAGSILLSHIRGSGIYE